MLDKYIENPEANADLLDCLKLDSVRAPSSVNIKAEAEAQRVRNFTRADWEERRAIIQDFIVSFSNAVGAGDDSFNENYSVAATNADRTPTDDEYEALFAFNDLLSEIDQIIYEKYGEQTETTSSLDYVAGLASASGVAFQKPISKFPVPFPYGSTLEQLASIYLGDPDRWHEIATLNGLRDPYVDEVGFDVKLTGNGEGNRLPVESAENLQLNQTVWVSAPAVQRTKRHILDISETNGYVVLTLDGDSDLALYSAANGAVLHAFLPDTVNSQMVIYIPSMETPASDDDELPIPTSDKYDSLINVAGVDLLLTNENDLVITPDGDGRWAFGLNHLVQRVRVVFGTPRGSLIRHPSFGVPVEVGKSVADLSMRDLKKAVGTLFSGDPAFNSVSNISVVQTGPALNIALGLEVVGVEQPIAVAVKALR
jgi:hypothetical protein